MSVIETGKEIAKLAQQLGSIEIQQKIIDLQSEMLSIQEELQTLRQENEAFKNTNEIDQALVLRENAYWLDSAPETRQGPFCKRCWDVERMRVGLNVSSSGHQKCPECTVGYDTTESIKAQREAIQRRKNRPPRRARSIDF